MSTKTPSLQPLMSRRRHALPCASAICLAIAALPAFAQETVAEFKMGEIVISGANGGVEKLTTVRTVTAEDIRQSGARTLNEALALLPGVNIRTGGDGTPRVQVRGFESRHVKLLLNGIPLNATSDGNFDPTMIPVEQIARIKLSAGSSSLLYGDGSLGGAINIITRAGSGPLHLGSAGLEGGNNQARGWMSLSGASGAIDYFVSVSQLSNDGFPLSKDFVPTALQAAGDRVNSDVSRSNLYANLGYAATSALALALTARHTEGAHGMPPGTLNTTDPFASKAKYERINNESLNNLQLSAEYAAGGAWSGRGWLFYGASEGDDNSYDNASFNSVSNPKLNNTFLLHNQTRVNGGHVQTTLRTPALGALTLALDDRDESWSSVGMLHNVAASGGNFTPRNVSYSRDVNVQSAVLEYAVTPIERLDLSAGASTYRQTRDDSSSHSASAYLLGAAYTLPSNTTLRAAASRQVRLPTITQLYDATSGDANLKIESARNRELAVAQQFGGNVSAELVLFHNDVYNYIEKDDVSNKYRNFDHYRFSGYELNGNAVLGGVRLRASYTYLKSDNLSAGAAFAPLQYRPRNNYRLEANYDFPYGVSANASVLTASHQYYYSRTTPTQQAMLNNYTLLNFKLSKRLSDSGAALYVGANNATNKNYETAYGFPQAGRVLFVGIEYAK